MTAPYVGMPVLYRLRPGQVRAGQTELAALITRINPAREHKVEKVITAKVSVKTRDEYGKTVDKVTEEQRAVPDIQMGPESVDLIVFPPNAPPMVQQNIVRLSDTVTGHCWRPDDSLGAVREDLAKAKADIAELSRQIVELADMVTKPEQRASARKNASGETARQ